jgi:hypothetical protein
VYTAWQDCIGKKTKVAGESEEYTLEVVKWEEGNKGALLLLVLPPSLQASSTLDWQLTINASSCWHASPGSKELRHQPGHQDPGRQLQ